MLVESVTLRVDQRVGAGQYYTGFTVLVVISYHNKYPETLIILNQNLYCCGEDMCN